MDLHSLQYTYIHTYIYIPKLYSDIRVSVCIEFCITFNEVWVCTTVSYAYVQYVCMYVFTLNMYGMEIGSQLRKIILRAHLGSPC